MNLMQGRMITTLNIRHGHNQTRRYFVIMVVLDLMEKTLKKALVIVLQYGTRCQTYSIRQQQWVLQQAGG